MTGRRAIVGLCMLCALLVSAFAAQSANAEVFGTTGTAPAGTGYTGAITGEGGTTKLHSVISGIEFELESTGFIVTGSAESMVEGKEHTSNGTGQIHYTNVTVVKPAGKGCEVASNTVTTNVLKATTAKQGMGLKIEPGPGSGGVFAAFNVQGCGESEGLKALNGKYEFTGSVIGVPTEGTNETVFERTPTTIQNTLKMRGQKSGLSGTLKLNTSGGPALKASTVTTP